MTFFCARAFFLIIVINTCSADITVTAQTTLPEHSTDTASTKTVIDYRYQRDLIDIGYLLFHKNPDTRLDTSGNKKRRLHISAAPIVEYTTATGFATGIAGNAAFTTNLHQKTNTSNFLGAIKVTGKKQFLMPIQSSIWTPGNKYNLVGDWRYLDYPQDAFGFGGHTSLDDKYIVGFKYIRLYEQVLRNIGNNFYLGLGYQFDHHWNITESEVQTGRITDFQKYGFKSSSTSSGIAMDVIYDSRQNSINPEGGSSYANIQFVQNATLLGANTNWSELIIDLRKYIKMPLHTVLAIWYYNVISISGNAPYLDLPATGSDTYSNTGRGYEQNRFNGKNMMDLEAELRFKISKNGLLGGVIFGSAESLSELGSNKFEVISPAVGFGLRIKFNKFSATNACLDYGIGTRGSRGFAGNLGEVF